MENPVLVEVTRGPLVESRHRGAFAVVDAAGAIVASAGDIERPVYPRSAIKVFQALPLVESGAADAFGFGDAELSLACASHSGEPGHAALAASMLERAGLGPVCLECGAHWPFDPAVARDMARAGAEPTPLHNNCSGKHAGFLCTAAHLGEDVAGYVRAEHAVQRRVTAAIADVTGAALSPDVCGTDGCSIPTYAAPLASFARGFARLAAGAGVPAERARAGRRLIEACMARPWEMSGTGRVCRSLMEAAPGRIFAKTGAEGVFCGALPERGLGFALKIDDGATRAAECLVAALLAELVRAPEPDLAARLDALAAPVLRNWEGVEVGGLRPTPAVAAAVR